MKPFWKYSEFERDLEEGKLVDAPSVLHFIEEPKRFVQYPKCGRKMKIKIFLVIFFHVKEQDLLMLQKDDWKNEVKTFNFFFIFELNLNLNNSILNIYNFDCFPFCWL
jgi:hypothetical protein